MKNETMIGQVAINERYVTRKELVKRLLDDMALEKSVNPNKSHHKLLEEYTQKIEEVYLNKNDEILLKECEYLQTFVIADNCVMFRISNQKLSQIAWAYVDKLSAVDTAKHILEMYNDIAANKPKEADLED